MRAPRSPPHLKAHEDMRRTTCLFTISILFLNVSRLVLSVLTNISIDDASSDPLTGTRITYGLTNDVTGGWNVGQACSGCFAQPDASQAFNGTWHDSSYSPTREGEIPYAFVSFTGVAVYVMGIFVSTAPESNTSLNHSTLFFQINGTLQGSFIRTASIGSEIEYTYNTPYFVKENLPFGNHNITILNGDNETAVDSLCLLDRILYTADISPTNSSSSVSNTTPTASATQMPLPGNTSKISRSPSTGLIVGVVVGFILLITAITGAVLRHRRGRSRETNSMQITTPFARESSEYRSNWHTATDSYQDATTTSTESDPPDYVTVIGDTTGSGGSQAARSVDFRPGEQAGTKKSECYGFNLSRSDNYQT